MGISLYECRRACWNLPRRGRLKLSRPVRLTRERSFQVDVSQREFVLAWKARGHGELDPPDATADQCADLQELEADGAAGGIGETRDAGHIQDDLGWSDIRMVDRYGWDMPGRGKQRANLVQFDTELTRNTEREQKKKVDSND